MEMEDILSDIQSLIWEIYFIFVFGGAGSTNDTRYGSAAGGYNGGGYGEKWQANSNSYGGGGGDTHIAKNSNLGILSSYSSNQSAVLIVAGGGGGSTSTSGGGAGGGSSYSGSYGNSFGKGSSGIYPEISTSQGIAGGGRRRLDGRWNLDWRRRPVVQVTLEEYQALTIME